jgi:two-component system, OmpR family, sensor histidine kinase KdpD
MAVGEARASHASAWREAAGGGVTRDASRSAGRGAGWGAGWAVPVIRLPPLRGLAGYGLAVALAALVTVLLAVLHGPTVFIAVAAVVSLLAGKAVRHAGQAAAAIAAAEPIAEADRVRTALLAAVSHDLRTPLAAAKASVSCLRSRDIELTAEDHDELLAAADESLDLLIQLVASLLDVSRLQAGALPVFARPADLGEIVARSLDATGPLAQAAGVSVPRELPPVMVDPAILERVIANVTANALRYSPGGSPPLLTACTRADRVDLRVIDHGPGVPEADRDRMFMPFRQLGGAGSAIGVGLGLTVARGLTEAMRGTLEPEETPGGGLTMIISLPVARGPTRLPVDGPVSGRRGT